MTNHGGGEQKKIITHFQTSLLQYLALYKLFWALITAARDTTSLGIKEKKDKYFAKKIHGNIIGKPCVKTSCKFRNVLRLSSPNYFCYFD